MEDDLKSFWKQYKWMFVLTIMLILVAYGTVLIFGKDNPIEQEIEKMIEKETGFPVDLTP